MAFPTFTACIVDNCTKLRITDTSGVYDADLNTNGWGSPNPTPGTVTTAVIRFGKYGETEYEEFDVESEIPATIDGEFTYSDLELDDYEDGYYTVTYIITTASQTYTRSLNYYFTCSARCCIDKMWAAVAAECECGCTQEELINNALMAEGLLFAIKAAASCNKTDGRDALLAKINRICEGNECNCND